MADPLRVLILEDRSTDAELMALQLRSAGYAVTWQRVETESAFHAHLQGPDLPDVVLAGYSLPQFDALAALALLQASGLDIPFIVVTGSLNEEEAVAAMKRGAGDYLIKDRLGRLGEAVRHVLLEKQDRAEKQRALGGLQESEERYRQTVDTAGDAIVLADAAGVIIAWNRGAEAMFGYSEAAVLGQPLTLLMPDRYREAHLRGLSRLNETGISSLAGKSVELEAVDSDGRAFPIEVTLSTWVSAAGRFVCGIIRNISERKQAEHALQTTNRQLEDALAEIKSMQSRLVQQERLRALGQMASGIAHDLNNALSPVLGFSELLLSVPENLQDTDLVRRYVELIRTGGADAANVVRRLREFYRQSEPVDSLTRVSLAPLVAEALALTEPKWKSEAQAKGISIEGRRDVEAALELVCNPSSVRELLVNLILNAVDAMPRGGTLTVRGRKDAETALLEVSDTGVGMSEEVRRRCLEPFYTTKGQHGSGLGLAMSYGIVQRHQGSIDIESAPGHGTTFRVRLPLQSDQKPRPAQSRLLKGVRPGRVLIVDDQPLVREYIRACLEEDRHTVTLAGNGAEALDLFRRAAYDVVVTDLAMPGINGDELAATLKALAPEIRVILLSGFGDLLQETSERPPGVDTVLAKPIKPDLLKQAVALAVGQRQE